jgi:predicted DNA-binding protein YlxM (UPF0122 family)
MSRERSPYYDTIYQLTSQGESPKVITEKLNGAISRQRIHQIREQIFYQHPSWQTLYERKEEAKKRELLENVKNLLNQGFSVKEISEIVNVCKSSLYRYLKEASIQYDRVSKPPIIKKGTQVSHWLVGDMFNKFSGEDKVRYYHCTCLGCSKVFEVSQSNLLSGKSKSCQNCSYKYRNKL